MSAASEAMRELEGAPEAAPQPLPDQAVLSLAASRGRYACVTDLHYGYEVELELSGISVPSQTERLTQLLLELARSHAGLVILGDVKHIVPTPSRRESLELPSVFERLCAAFEEVHLILGNHDAGLRELLPPSVHLHPSSGWRLGGVGLFHGHTWPSREAASGRWLVMGHAHPAYAFQDRLGTVMTEKCWLRCALDPEGMVRRFGSAPEELIVMPAFHPLLTGTPLNTPDEELLGPLFRNGLAASRSAEVYLLDGTRLGPPQPLPARPRRAGARRGARRPSRPPERSSPSGRAPPAARGRRAPRSGDRSDR